MKLQRSVALCLVAAFLLLPLFAGAAAAADKMGVVTHMEVVGRKKVVYRNQ